MNKNTKSITLNNAWPVKNSRTLLISCALLTNNPTDLLSKKAMGKCIKCVLKIVALILPLIFQVVIDKVVVNNALSTMMILLIALLSELKLSRLLTRALN
jgi:hypothetical protein